MEEKLLLNNKLLSLLIEIEMLESKILVAVLEYSNVNIYLSIFGNCWTIRKA